MSGKFELTTSFFERSSFFLFCPDLEVAFLSVGTVRQSPMYVVCEMARGKRAIDKVVTGSLTMPGKSR